MIKKTGFTLIELLVVIFIIGIVSAAILFRNNSHHDFNEMHSFAEELTKELQLAQSQALSRTSTLGLMMHEQSYEFYQQNTTGDKSWVPLKQTDNFWRTYTLPTDVELDISTKTEPPIIFMPTGDITAFTITVHNKNVPRTLQITGTADGNIALQDNP